MRLICFLRRVAVSSKLLYRFFHVSCAQLYFSSFRDKENLYLSFLPPGSVAPGEMTKFIDAVDKKIQESNEVTEDDAQVKIVEAAQKWDDYGETVFIVYNAVSCLSSLLVVSCRY